MNFKKLVLTLTALVSLSACTAYESFSELNQLNNSTAVGSPFTQKLAEEYRTFSNFQLKQDYDYINALHFARKGLAAVEGILVMPEPIGDWSLYADQMQELGMARARLITAYEMGAIEQFPQISAVAQSRFDCWIEAEEEASSAKLPYVIPCKTQFFDALTHLETRIQQMMPPKPAPESSLYGGERFPEPIEPVNDYSSQPVAIEDAVYLIFFDFNSSRIGSGANSIVDTIVSEINSRSLNRVTIVGHADSSGAKAYNQALGLKRANSVKAALVQQGIPNAMLATVSRGETELLVQTADGVREPANRRAEIKFE